MNRNKLTAKPTIIIVIVVVLVGLIVWLFAHKDTSQPNKTTANNTIDLSPAKPQDNEMVNKQKEDGSLNKPTPAATFGVSISRLVQLEDKSLAARATVDGVSEGDCTLTAVNAGKTITKVSKVVNKGTYYGCDGFDIAYSELTAGTWDVTVAVKSGDETANAHQSITIGL